MNSKDGLENNLVETMQKRRINLKIEIEVFMADAKKIVS